jgi:hypothetical protein
MDWQVTYGDQNTPVKVLNKGKEMFSLDDPNAKKEFFKLTQPAQGQAPDMAKIQSFMNQKANSNKMNMPPDFVLANMQDQPQNAQPAQQQAQAPAQQPAVAPQAGQDNQPQDDQNPLEPIDLKPLKVDSYIYDGKKIFISEDTMESLNAFKRNANVMIPKTDGKSIWKTKAEQAKKHMQENASKIQGDSFVSQMAELYEADSKATNSDTQISTTLKNIKKPVKTVKDEGHQDVDPADIENNVTPETKGAKTVKNASAYMDKKLAKGKDERLGKPLQMIKGRQNFMDRGQPEDAENLKTDVMSTPGEMGKGFGNPEAIKKSKTGFGKMEASKKSGKQLNEAGCIQNADGSSEYHMGGNKYNSCKKCKGNGKTANEECSECGGSGFEKSNQGEKKPATKESKKTDYKQLVAEKYGISKEEAEFMVEGDWGETHDVCSKCKGAGCVEDGNDDCPHCKGTAEEPKTDKKETAKKKA